MTSLQYKKVLVLGATSGIGWALAAKVLEYNEPDKKNMLTVR